MSSASSVDTVETKPYNDQKPGTSGLRKKVRTFTENQYYLENFIQSIFNAVSGVDGSTIVVSGDGRYYTDVAVEAIFRIAAANGVKKIIMGQNYLMSTPAVSAVIRERNALGGIILTASHNPGGPDGDFGIKYNNTSGGPATEEVTSRIYEESKQITSFKRVTGDIQVDVSAVGSYSFAGMEIEIMDAPSSYASLMASIFDFDRLRALFKRDDFSFLYDAMHGVAGPFAKEVFVNQLGADSSSVINAEPKPDFGGGHPDPNLTYAHELVERMGLDAKSPIDDDAKVPYFGAAADGDADRNMILGRRFFVTPSDSVAIISAYASQCIPFFKDGLKGVARSMPTSQALDRVATKLGVKCYEVPTGWKFFGNLMDAGRLSICGEESFGTGSDHVREKDGIWAVLAWLSLLEFKSRDAAKLVSVEEVVRDYWRAYGRNFYTRYDYEEVSAESANKLMDTVRAMIPNNADAKSEEYELDHVDEFSYTDETDGSVASNQGLRVLFKDGSRFVLRLSGTGSVGATVRLYVERYEPDPEKVDRPVADALASLIELALTMTNLRETLGRDAPTVIT